MKIKLHRSLAVAGGALILLSGCVSSRKYKASQAALAKVRSDSAQLAQQIAQLNGNVQEMQGKNTSLQSALDSSRNQYTEQQKSLQYYQNYYKEGQDTLAAVSQDLQGVLSQAGLTNADVQQQNDAIYVRLDENDVFKKNTTVVTPTGQKVLDGIAQVVSNRPDANITVAAGDSAVGMKETMAESQDLNHSLKRHHSGHVHHTGTAGSGSGSANGSATAGATGGSAPAGNTASASKSQGASAPAHHNVHHHYSSEGSMAFSSGGHRPGWSLKQARMVAVANHFLKNGAPKVNVSLQRPPMNGAPQSTAIKIIIRPSRRELTPRNSSAMAEMGKQ